MDGQQMSSHYFSGYIGYILMAGRNKKLVLWLFL